MIVDDEPDTLRTLDVVLSEIGGYDVTSDGHPRNALTDFRSNSYDLLVLDILMPDIHGFELYRQMKSTLTEKDAAMTTVCFLTALVDFERYGGYKLEVCPTLKERRFFVKKPVENEDLLERVRNMLDTEAN